MVQADAGNDAEFRGDYIGAVQAAAKTYFDNGDIHILVLEPFERQPGSYLEKGEFHFIEHDGPLFEEIIDIFLGNKF